MIVSEIQNEAILRLGAGARTTPSNLLNAIDEGNKRIYNKLVKVHKRLFYKTASWNAVNGQNEYTSSDGVPTDIKEVLKVETRYSSQANRVQATKIELDNIRRMDEISTAYKNINRPNYYWFGNGSNITIGFVPTHDVSGQDYNKVWYLAQPTRITDGSQTPLVPEDAHFLIVEFAFAVAQLIEDEDSNGYLAFLKRFDQDVLDWVETEYPGTSEPVFTQDAEE